MSGLARRSEVNWRVALDKQTKQADDTQGDLLRLTDLVDEFLRRYEADPAGADRALLASARDILERVFIARAEPLPAAAVHAGQRIYARLREREALVTLLSRYVAQRLSVEEEEWARRLLVDNLALLRRHADAVAAQHEFLAWARAHLPAERHFRVLQDGTQALSWVAVDQTDEWLAVVRELFGSAPATPENRDARFNCLRTASGVLARTGRTDEAFRMAAAVGAIGDEDPHWYRAFDMRAEAASLELNTCTTAERITDLHRVGVDATRRLTEHIAQLGGTAAIADPALRKRLAMSSHNTAAPLFRGGQYDLAIPLFRLALALGVGASPPLSSWPYGWLAASLWATERDRETVLPLLRDAAARYDGSGDTFWRALRKYPELADVADDPEFAAAATIPG